MSEEQNNIKAEEMGADEAPARAQDYLSAAGIPAGLLLAEGSRSVLKRVGDNEVYQKEASTTLSALAWAEAIGIAIALMSLMAFLSIFRKLFWRSRT